MKNEHELRSQFSEFCQQNPGQFADFELLDSAIGSRLLGSLLGKRLAQHFMALGKHGSNSVIAQWHLSDDSQPWVWLDSEGSPNSVFAATLADVLQLLPYDTGAIYDLVTAWNNHNAEPDSYPSPITKYGPKRMAKYVAAIRKEHPQYEAFGAWLTGEAGLQPCPYPAKGIGEAIAQFPNLSSWLQDKKESNS